MDVYVGFGLLSAAVVVLVFVFFDSWFRARNAGMAELTGLNDKSLDDPEFVLSAESNELADLELHGSTARASEFVRDDDVSEILTDVHYSSSELDNLYEMEEFNEEVNHTVEQAIADNTAMTDEASIDTVPSAPENLLVLSVMAKPDSRFVSYDLFQAIATVGLQFGEMNIFHYYQQTASGKISLFSLASANKPGDFDLNNIGDFSCTGLMLFMNIADVPDPQTVFRLMLETAERLADDLDGELRANPHTPWDEKLVWQYQQKIMHYKTMGKYDRKA
jgi:cell division protein ZipA